MTRLNRIKRKLDALKPHYCEVIDESHDHIGHIDWNIESHFRVKISSDEFINKNLLTQHKIINELLADELANGMHALSIEIKKTR